MIANPTAIKLPRPHRGQMQMLDCVSKGISVVAFCGRRFGKTQVAVYAILRGASTNIGLYWWVGLSWRSASLKRAWRLLKHYVRQIWLALGKKPDKYIREADKELYLPNGSSIWLRTAERPDSLAGEGLRGVVLDEFSLMDEIVWTEYIEATLLDYPGSWALFIGVPKGENWAATLWRKASSRKGWKALHFTTYDNPRMSAERINDIKDNVTEAVFNQEYMAEITADAGAVFRGVNEVLTAPLDAEPQADHLYTMGVDWGRSNDYTAIVVMDKTAKRMVAKDHFNQISWALQRGRLQKMIERWNPTVVLAEENSIGSPNIEALQMEGFPVHGFMTTASSKPPLIEKLALAIESKDIELLPDETLKNELQAYTMERMPSGSFRYGAPSGMHDDLVIATALSLWSQPGEAFVSIQLWDDCKSEIISDLGGRGVIMGIYSSPDDGCCAIVTVSLSPEHKAQVRYCRIWAAPPGGKINFNDVENELARLFTTSNVEEVAYDETQLVSIAQRLSANVFWRKFPQDKARSVADKRLYDMIRDRQIEHSGEPELRQHLINADRKPDEDKLRIVRRYETQRIEAVVALSMAIDRLMYYQ